MKLAYTIAAFAFAGAVGGLGMTGTAHAQTLPQGRVCSSNPYTDSHDCGYHSLSQCVRFAVPNGSSCHINWNRMLYSKRMPY